MKRMFLLLSCLALLLAACGPAQEPVTTTASAPTLASNAETKNGVAWRVLDSEDKANAAARQFLDTYLREEEQKYSAPGPHEYAFGKNKTIFIKEFPDRWEEALREIWLRDNSSGKETLLLKGNGKSGEAWEAPHFADALDDRYFTYQISGYEWEAGCGVYDTETFRDIPINRPAGTSYAGSYNGTPYLWNYIYDYESDGQLYVYPMDISSLETAKELKVSGNLLAGIPEANFSKENYSRQWISPDARFYIVTGQNALCVFDLQQRTFLCKIPRLPEDDLLNYQLAMNGDRTLYCFEGNIMTPEGQPAYLELTRYMIEITLP